MKPSSTTRWESWCPATPTRVSRLVLDGDCIRPVGFERDEALVESPPRSFPGYELLTEYFVFPQKFLFFDVTGLGPEARRRFGDDRTLHIDICLDRLVESLERYVTTQTFQLGCCPIVNLFRQRAESMLLTQHQTEYRVVPDARRPRAYEVHSIDQVTAMSPGNDRVEFSPFYSSTHHRAGDGDDSRFWHASRRPAEAGSPEDRTEVFLSLVDTEFSPRRRKRMDPRRDDHVPQSAAAAVRWWSAAVPARRRGPAAEDCLSDGAHQDLPTGAHVRGICGG